jgi:hypothetical protein
VQFLVSDKSVPEQIAKPEIAKVVAYWTEPIGAGTRQRWQAQKFSSSAGG